MPIKNWPQAEIIHTELSTLEATTLGRFAPRKLLLTKHRSESAGNGQEDTENGQFQRKLNKTLTAGTFGRTVHLGIKRSSYLSPLSDHRVSMLERRCIDAIVRVVCWPVAAAASSASSINLASVETTSCLTDRTSNAIAACTNILEDLTGDLLLSDLAAASAMDLSAGAKLVLGSNVVTFASTKTEGNSTFTAAITLVDTSAQALVCRTNATSVVRNRSAWVICHCPQSLSKPNGQLHRGHSPTALHDVSCAFNRRRFH